MKKLLVLCLTVILCLCCLTSCNSLKHEHTSVWEYNTLTHWQVVTCSLNICDFNMPAPSEHVDEDCNGACDVCGYCMSVTLLEEHN